MARYIFIHLYKPNCKQVHRMLFLYCHIIAFIGCLICEMTKKKVPYCSCADSFLKIKVLKYSLHSQFPLSSYSGIEQFGFCDHFLINNKVFLFYTVLQLQTDMHEIYIVFILKSILKIISTFFNMKNVESETSLNQYNKYHI